MSEDVSTFERLAATAFGGLLLLIAASLFGWGVRLTVAGLSSDWPPGLGQLLLPVGLTAVFVGFGSWRLLLMGFPMRMGGLSLGWAVLATFGVAGVAGAII